MVYPLNSGSIIIKVWENMTSEIKIIFLSVAISLRSKAKKNDFNFEEPPRQAEAGFVYDFSKNQKILQEK